MAKSNHLKGTRMLAATVVLATLLGTLLLAQVATAETVGTESFPGSTGAIAFVSTRDDARNWQVYRMNPDGFGQTRITDAPGLKFDPSWSADGTKLTFSNRVLGEPGDVYQVGADGSGQKNLTNAPSDDGASSYSLASTNRFAFTSNRTNNQYDVYLTTLGPDGQTTELTRLTTNPATDGSPVISPDGRRIAFVSDRDGDEDIYVMRLAPEGSKNVPVKLTKNTRPDPNGPPYMYDFEPDWSPDGTQIVFTSDRSGNMEIYRMKASPEGSKNRPVNLSKSPSSYDSSAAWSPDGKKIAFSSDRPAPDGTRDYEIWRMRATDGANPINLTNDPGSDFYPAWQPLP
jgi:Tol biopolymer transport system component